MPGIMASSLETVAEGPPEEDSLDGVLDSMQMPEIIGTLLSEEGSLKAPITMVVMADGSGKAGAMNQDVLSEVIDEFAKKEAFLTYLENEAGASFKVAAHLTIDEAGAASLYDVAGGGKAYKGIKVYTMAEAAGIPAYAARMEGVVVLFFTQTPSGLDVSNPEHLKLFSEMVTLFFTARTGGKTFLEMRATQLLTSGIITATEAAKYKDPIVACKEAKPISTFGGSWTGKRGNLKTMNKIYVVTSFNDSSGKPFTPSFLPQKMAISDRIVVRAVSPAPPKPYPPDRAMTNQRGLSPSRPRPYCTGNGAGCGRGRLDQQGGVGSHRHEEDLRPLPGLWHPLPKLLPLSRRRPRTRIQVPAVPALHPAQDVGTLAGKARHAVARRGASDDVRERARVLLAAVGGGEPPTAADHRVEGRVTLARTTGAGGDGMRLGGLCALFTGRVLILVTLGTMIAREPNPEHGRPENGGTSRCEYNTLTAGDQAQTDLAPSNTNATNGAKMTRQRSDMPFPRSYHLPPTLEEAKAIASAEITRERA